MDDEHNKGSESLTLTLSDASSGDITDASATGTITNHDPLPKALVARFGRTAGSSSRSKSASTRLGHRGSTAASPGARSTATWAAASRSTSCDSSAAVDTAGTDKHPAAP